MNRFKLSQRDGEHLTASSLGCVGESSSTTMTTTTTTTVSQTALTSASWSVLLPQITATIRKEVGEAMHQTNTMLRLVCQAH